MKKTKLVSIVIPTHNRKRMLIRLIDGLLANSYKNIEIIIIDDASTDGTASLIEERYTKNKTVRIFSNKNNLYTAGSRNKGASLAKGEYIFFIDDDNAVTPTIISCLVTVMDEDNTVGEVGPIMYFYTDKNKLFWAGTNRNMTTTRTHFINTSIDIPSKNVWETDDVLNAFMVRASVLKKHDISFMENLGIMYEESDYAWKIRKAGFKILVVKEAVIYHDVEDINTKRGGFLQHTLRDKKRIYFTARNRLIFHSMYSSLLQMAGILCFWNWLFAGFYVKNILGYQGEGKYSVYQKLQFCGIYIHGMYDGIKFAFTHTL